MQWRLCKNLTCFAGEVSFRPRNKQGKRSTCRHQRFVVRYQKRHRRFLRRPDECMGAPSLAGDSAAGRMPMNPNPPLDIAHLSAFCRECHWMRKLRNWKERFLYRLATAYLDVLTQQCLRKARRSRRTSGRRSCRNNTGKEAAGITQFSALVMRWASTFGLCVVEKRQVRWRWQISERAVDPTGRKMVVCGSSRG